jgi:hypothetical protein
MRKCLSSITADVSVNQLPRRAVTMSVGTAALRWSREQK